MMSGNVLRLIKRRRSDLPTSGRPDTWTLTRRTATLSATIALGGRILDALRRTEDIARRINGRGVLLLILSDEFSFEDSERWVSQVEARASDYPSVLQPIYIARYSEFLAESALNFAGRVIPPDLPSL